jgi:hypothetical protein
MEAVIRRLSGHGTGIVALRNAKYQFVLCTSRARVNDGSSTSRVRVRDESRSGRSVETESR